MAQADVKEDLQDASDSDSIYISEFLTYNLKGVKSNKYLQGNYDNRGKQKVKYTHMKEWKGDEKWPNDDDLKWKFKRVADDIYALVTLDESASGFYLHADIRDGDKNRDLDMRKGYFRTDTSLQWRVKRVKENKVGLQSVKSGNYISGRDRNGGSNPTMQIVGEPSAKGKERQDGKIDEFLQWWLIPTQYTLYCYLSHFNFGDSKTVKQFVQDGKQKCKFEALQDARLNVKEKDSKLTVDRQIRHESSFKWSLSKDETIAIGIGNSTSFTADIPLIAGDDTRVGSTFEMPENQQWQINESKIYNGYYEFKPTQTGVYQIDITAHETSNVRLGFEAKVTYEAKDEDNVRLATKELVALLFYYQSKPKIQFEENFSCSGTVTGQMTATYVIDMDMNDQKIT